MRSLSTLVLTLGLLSAAPGSALQIVPGSFTFGGAEAYGGDQMIVNQLQLEFETFPTSNQAVAGTSSSFNTYDVSDAGIRIDFEHTSEYLGGSYGAIHFTLPQNLQYTALGAYDATNQAGTQVQLEISLRDVAADTYVFRSFQASQDTANESLVVGETGGDFGNLLTGSLTGTLVAGREYVLTYNGAVFRQAAVGQSGAGFIELQLVPEPGTSLLFALGLAGLAGRCRIRR
jgi:hypothetical protein